MLESVEYTKLQFVLAALGSMLIQQMKLSPLSLFRWISKSTPTVSKIVAAITAAATTAGITWTFNDGTLLVTGLTDARIIKLLVEFISTYVFQLLAYRLMYPVDKPVVNPQQ